MRVTDPDLSSTDYDYSNPDVPTEPTTVTDGRATSPPTSTISTATAASAEPDRRASTASGDPSCQWSSGYTFDTFDALGNVTSSEDPSGNTTSYTRHDNVYPSDVTTISTPVSGDSTNYSYDRDGRVLEVQEPSGQDVSYAYAPTGQKCWQAPVANVSATCGTSLPVGGSSWSFYNSELSQTMTDQTTASTHNTTSWSYDPDGRLMSETRSAGYVGYGYDAVGDNTCVAYPVTPVSSCCRT